MASRFPKKKVNGFWKWAMWRNPPPPPPLPPPLQRSPLPPPLLISFSDLSEKAVLATTDYWFLFWKKRSRWRSSHHHYWFLFCKKRSRWRSSHHHYWFLFGEKRSSFCRVCTIVGWRRWPNLDSLKISKILWVCARIRVGWPGSHGPKISKTKELRRGDMICVSGHPERTIRDEAAALQTQQLFEKSTIFDEIWSKNHQNHWKSVYEAMCWKVWLKRSLSVTSFCLPGFFLANLFRFFWKFLLLISRSQKPRKNRF